MTLTNKPEFTARLNFTCLACNQPVKIGDKITWMYDANGDQMPEYQHLNCPKRIHFVYGSGEHGCLYDTGPCACITLQEAVDSLAETFELGRTRKARLKRDQYLELNPRRDGASYCAITTCNCDKPWEHNECDSAENDYWSDYLSE